VPEKFKPYSSESAQKGVEKSKREKIKSPVVETLKFPNAPYVEQKVKIIIDRLKKLGLYNPDLLYRGFSGENIQRILEYGTDSIRDEEEGYDEEEEYTEDVVYCSSEKDLTNEYGTEQSAIEYALREEVPALAVYDGKKLESTPVPYEYEAKESNKLKDALIAIFNLDIKR